MLHAMIIQASVLWHTWFGISNSIKCDKSSTMSFQQPQRFPAQISVDPAKTTLN